MGLLSVGTGLTWVEVLLEISRSTWEKYFLEVSDLKSGPSRFDKVPMVFSSVWGWNKKTEKIEYWKDTLLADWQLIWASFMLSEWVMLDILKPSTAPVFSNKGKKFIMAENHLSVAAIGLANYMLNGHPDLFQTNCSYYDRFSFCLHWKILLTIAWPSIVLNYWVRLYFWYKHLCQQAIHCI